MVSAIAVAMASLIVTSCVKIETGQTPDEAKASSEARASQIRSEFALQMRGATPPDIAALMATHFERVTGAYFQFGNEVIKQWEEGEKGRGQAIDGAEMRKFVTAWTDGQQPILTAYDDNLEYAFAQLEQSQYFRESFLHEVQALVDKYYEAYSVVFLPTGSLDDYKYKLDQERYSAENQVAGYREALSAY